MKSTIDKRSLQLSLHWVEDRRRTLCEGLDELSAAYAELKEKNLLLPQDDKRLKRVAAEVSDYLTALAKDPERTYASDKDLSLSGPVLKIPLRPECWTSAFYVQRVDAHVSLLKEIARARLSYERMIHNPRAASADDLSARERASRVFATFERNIYDACENTPEYRAHLEWMNKALEDIATSELDSPNPPVERYRLESVVAEVTGASRICFDQLELDMSAEDLLSQVRVAEEFPTAPPLRPITPTEIESPIENVSNWLSENSATLKSYGEARIASWRPLSDEETAEIICRFQTISE